VHVAYLRTVSEREATGEVAEVYRDIRRHMGSVPALFCALSTDPMVLQEAWRAYPYAMDYGALGRAEREITALAVARVLACRYGTDAATHQLVEMGMQHAQIAALFREPAKPPTAQDTLIALAEALTRGDEGPLDTQIAAMRNAGLGEQEIREAATVCVWFNLLDRLVDGLGVPHNPVHRPGAIRSIRTAAYDIATRLWRTGEVPEVAARPEAGAGETAVVILRQLIRRLEPLRRLPPKAFRTGIEDSPRTIDQALIQNMRDDGWDDEAIFHAALVLAGRRAMACWEAVLRHLDDPLSGSHPEV
jgi:uncharacterized peroxidase-related enzyme